VAGLQRQVAIGEILASGDESKATQSSAEMTN